MYGTTARGKRNQGGCRARPGLARPWLLVCPEEWSAGRSRALPPRSAPASARCRRSRAYQHYVRFAPKTPGGLCGPLDVQRSRPRLDVHRPGIRAARDRDSPGASRVRPWPPPCPRARGVLDSERRVGGAVAKSQRGPTEQSSRRDPWHRTDAVDSSARQTGARYAPGAFAVSRPEAAERTPPRRARAAPGETAGDC